MHSHPEEPSQEAGKPYKPQIRNCVRAAYDREIPFVPVPEWLRRRALLCTTANHIGNIFALLDRRLSDSREDHLTRRFDTQQIARRSNDVGSVTYYEDIWMPWHRHVGRHNDLSISVSTSV